MKVNSFLLVIFGIVFVGPLSINAHKPKVVDHYKSMPLKAQERNEKKSDNKVEVDTPQLECPLPWLLKKVSKSYGLYYLASFYTTLVHEYGHALAAKLLLGCKSNIYLFPQLIGVDGFAEYYYDDGKFPVDFNKGFKRAAVAAAGPLAGLGFGYCMLKLYNICSEYIDKSKTITDSIKDGIKKPVFNSEQGLAFKTAVILSGLGNLANLIPRFC